MEAGHLGRLERRSRRLVISSVFTIGNYDYGFYWYLYLDGTIQMEVKLTGIVGVSAMTQATYNPSQSPVIGENLSSPVHQHLFCFRLDWQLDGGTNSLFENQIELMPASPQNPEGTQFQSVSRHLTTESEAIRDNQRLSAVIRGTLRRSEVIRPIPQLVADAHRIWCLRLRVRVIRYQTPW